MVKEKKDFITNSSTTCFFVYGGSFDPDDLRSNEDFMKILYEGFVEYRAKYYEGKDILPFKEWLTDQRETQCSMSEHLDTVLSKFNLDYVSEPYGDELYIGRDPFQMKDDQTMAEFKAAVKKSFEDMGIKDPQLGAIEEAWRDG